MYDFVRYQMYGFYLRILFINMQNIYRDFQGSVKLKRGIYSYAEYLKGLSGRFFLKLMRVGFLKKGVFYTQCFEVWITRKDCILIMMIT